MYIYIYMYIYIVKHSCIVASGLLNTVALLHLAFQFPGKPFFLSLVVHIAHGVSVLMWNL